MSIVDSAACAAPDRPLSDLEPAPGCAAVSGATGARVRKRRRPASSIRVLGYPSIRAAAEAWTDASRAAQGLPPRVTDARAIQFVVSILREARAEAEREGKPRKRAA